MAQALFVVGDIDTRERAGGTKHEDRGGGQTRSPRGGAPRGPVGADERETKREAWSVPGAKRPAGGFERCQHVSALSAPMDVSLKECPFLGRSFVVVQEDEQGIGVGAGRYIGHVRWPSASARLRARRRPCM